MKRRVSTGWIASGLVLQVCLLIPLQIQVVNSAEFSVGILELLPGLLIVTAVSLLLCWVALAVIPGAYLLAAGLSLAIFLQSTVLFALARHPPFYGDPIDWSGMGLLSGLEILTYTLTLVFVGTLFYLKKTPALRSLSLFIVIFHLISLGVQTAANRDAIVSSHQQFTSLAPDFFSRFPRLSSRQNVIQLIVDHTQGSLVYDLINQDLERYQSSLGGFTLFHQAAGKFPGTFPAVPHLMTGRTPEIDDQMIDSVPFSHQYIQQTLERHSVVNSLNEHGFETLGFQLSSLYCAGRFDGCIPGNIFDGQLLEKSWSERALTASLQLFDVVLFKITPVPVRRNIYADSQWWLRRMVTERRTISGVLEYLLDNLQVDDGPAAFRLMHHQGGHPPIQFGAQCQFTGSQAWTLEATSAQITCLLLQLEQLVETLQEAGIYDQTMIVVAGDHGSQWRPSLMPSQSRPDLPLRIISSANPLLLVKPIGASSGLTFSNAPVSLDDVAATIADVVGLAAEFPGSVLFDVNENAQRERVYYWFVPDPGVFQNQVLPNVTPYRIRGNLFDPESWVSPAAPE